MFGFWKKHTKAPSSNSPRDKRGLNEETPDFQEARKLVSEYAAVLEHQTSKGVLNPVSSLPCSKEEMRKALIRDFYCMHISGLLDAQAIKIYMECYILLSNFVDDEDARKSEKIAKAQEKLGTSHSKGNLKEKVALAGSKEVLEYVRLNEKATREMIKLQRDFEAILASLRIDVP